MGRFLVGIDLGTTNSALAYIDGQQRGRGGQPEIRSLPIPQLVGPGEVKERPLLPSFLYLPGEHDLPAGSAALPWDPRREFLVGEFARNHGGRVPGRLVSSAKSWLCHGGVDRTTGLLPWTAPPDVPRISPVEASARYIRHMIEAWNHTLARDKPENALEKQEVVLTVPASFDEVARTLTMEAAKKARLENVVLLEEPQAAFYCWLVAHPAGEVAQLQPGAWCLVVDVGGGTSDFSLIEAIEQQGELGFVRQAVGDHLLLGGDNMDLALAHFVENKLPGGGSRRLDATQYGLLTQACRQAKEALLSPSPPESVPVTVVGRGRAVIGGTLHTTLNEAEVHQVIVEGFFPASPFDADPARGARSGLHEMGLPYVSDPAITRHLSSFLRQQFSGSEKQSAPVAILFNGGVFQPASLREHLVSVLRSWFSNKEQPWEPLVLSNPSLEQAVARGAAYYGWLRHTGGKRIGGGIARSYYVGVEGVSTGGPEAEAEIRPVLCVVPQHLEEGDTVHLTQPELELSLGQPVSFPLYTSTVRGRDRAGDVLQVSVDQLLRLPSLETILRGGKKSTSVRQVPVTLEARSTAIGTLELFCVAKDGNNRWRLEFNIRDLVKEPASRAEEEGAGATGLGDVWPEAQVLEAGRLIRAVYTAAPDQAEVPAPKNLTRALEAALEARRADWPTSLCRRLWEFLEEVAEHRRLSPSHLSRWYNLVGWCLRPGFGDPLDRFRIDQLWKMMASARTAGKGPRPLASALTEGGSDAWIMWRRVSGGLNPSLQQVLFDRLRGYLLPGKGKGGFKPGANELAEMWRAAASLERLESTHKQALGEVLLRQVRRSPVPTYAFWSLTRLGARSLVYGPLNRVVHRQVVEGWLESLVGFQPANQSERMAWAFCLAQLTRRTGQRALDIEDSHRRSVLVVLRSLEIPRHWVDMVEKVVEFDQEEQGQLLGDALPIGLRLVPSEGMRAEG
jgi:hypothetical protein